MFRGNYPTRIDEKGRLKLPADFKREVDEKYGRQFYITSETGKTAKVFPLEEWEAIEQKLMAQPTMNPKVKKFLERTSYYGQVVEIDPQGRLTVPQLLRESANVRGEVAVMGQLRFLEVRNMEELRKEINENPFTDEDAEALNLLGI
jgi:MraZ protein